MQRRDYLVIACLVGTLVAPAQAQHRKSDSSGNALAAKISCQDFSKGSDGKWTAGSNARIGILDFSGRNFGVGAVSIGGADLATALERKCVAK